MLERRKTSRCSSKECVSDSYAFALGSTGNGPLAQLLARLPICSANRSNSNPTRFSHFRSCFGAFVFCFLEAYLPQHSYRHIENHGPQTLYNINISEHGGMQICENPRSF